MIIALQSYVHPNRVVGRQFLFKNFCHDSNMTDCKWLSIIFAQTWHFLFTTHNQPHQNCGIKVISQKLRSHSFYSKAKNNKEVRGIFHNYLELRNVSHLQSFYPHHGG